MSAPVIPPVPPGVHRPFWSVMIPAYDCAATLGDTLRSVLSQAPDAGVMEISVLDDASPGAGVGEVVRAVGGGRVGYARNPANLGVGGNANACLARARGRVVHLLHADDSVDAGFYAAMGAAFARTPGLGAAFARARYVDAQGRELGLSPEAPAGVIPGAAAFLAREQRIMTPAIVVAREAYERVGGFDARLHASEDWEMWVRVAARYPVWGEARVLASYRVHEASNTGRHARVGRDAYFNALAIDIMNAHLPADVAAEVRRAARATYARSALEAAAAAFVAGDMARGFAQIRGALRLSLSGEVLLGAAAAPLRAASRRLLGAARPHPAAPPQRNAP